MSNKQFGLILPKSKLGGAKAKPVAKAFNDSSDEDEETQAVVTGGTDWMKKKLSSKSSVNAKSGATGVGTKLKAQTKIELQKALEEDPSVFQYDEVYDQMEAAKVEQISQKKEKDRKPRYIESLLKHAEIRTKENERRIERQVQKEREAEGDQFADKEKFVTSAYRKKMEELQKLEEEDRKKDALENILDVTKQKDMSGFYRHLYRQTMGDEKGQKAVIKEEPVEEQNDVVEDDVQLSKKTKPSQRSYRRRDSEKVDENDDEGSNDDNEATERNSSSEDEDEEVAKQETEAKRAEKDKKRREELRKQKEARERRKRRIAEGRDTSSEEDGDEEESASDKEDNSGKKSGKKDTSSGGNKENIVSAQPAAKKAKVDIWKKVTVDKVFDDALQRYLLRKSERGSRFPW